jgi:hypothetical protein
MLVGGFGIAVPGVSNLKQSIVAFNSVHNVIKPFFCMLCSLVRMAKVFSGSSTVVEYLPSHPKVKGLSLDQLFLISQTLFTFLQNYLPY